MVFSEVQKVNIDIGTKILKQKCFGRKTDVFNTHSNFPPAIDFQISHRFRNSYFRPLFRRFVLKFRYDTVLQRVQNFTMAPKTMKYRAPEIQTCTFSRLN